MQAYGSLALEDNSEVGEIFPVSAPEADPQLAMGLSVRGFGDSLLVKWAGLAGLIPVRTNCERVWNCPGMPLHGLLSPTQVLLSKVGCLTGNGVSRAMFAPVVGIIGLL